MRGRPRERRNVDRCAVAGRAAVVTAALAACHALAAAPGPAEPAPRSEPPAAIRGTVVDEGDAPVAGALVLGLPAGASVVAPQRDPEGFRPPVLTTTGEDGSFRLAVEGSAPFRLLVRAAGYAVSTVAEATASEPLAVRLVDGMSLAGSVLDARSGRAIEGALVEACPTEALAFGAPLSSPSAGPDPGRHGCSVGRTADDGGFAIAHLPPGSVRVSALAAGRTLAPETIVRLRPSATGNEPGEAGARSQDAQVPPPSGLRILLEPGGRIAGRVLGPDGAGLADVRVLPQLVEATISRKRRAWNGLAVHTDAEGRFVFDGLAASAGYVLHAERLGWPPVETVPQQLEPGRTIDDVRIRLEEDARLAVRLVDAGGEPIGGALALWLREPIDDEAAPAYAMAGESLASQWISDEGDGRRRARNLPAGARDMTLQVEGYVPLVRRAVVLRSGRTTDLGTLPLAEGARLAGTVSDPSGAPISGASISATGLGPAGMLVWKTTSTDDGGFELGGLFPEPLDMLSASAAGYSAVTRRQVAPGGDELELVLQPTGSIAGVVVGLAGEPLPSFVVEVHRAASAESQTGPWFKAPVKRAFESDDGAFAVDGLSAGRYTLAITAPGHAPGTVDAFEVRAGEAIDVGRVRLEEGLTLTGRVVTADGGRPLPGASVELDDGSGGPFVQPGQARAVPTDAEGRFVLDGLAEGTPTLRAMHPEYAPAARRVELRRGGSLDDVLFELGSGGTLTGTVRENGEPAAGAGVFVSPGLMDIDLARTTRTDADGRYELRRLAAGTYQVLRVPEHGGMPFMGGMKSATVREGETTVVDLGDEPAIRVSGVVRLGRQSVGQASLLFVFAGGAASGVGLASASTDGAGRYEVGLERPGVYRVSLQSDRGLDFKITEVTVPEAREVSLDIAFGSGAIEGRVADEKSEPVSGTVVAATRTDATPAAGAAVDGTAVTGADGTYRVEGLEAGVYDVQAIARGFAVEHRPGVAVEADATRAGIDFTLRRGRPLRGRVVDPGGSPVASAWVFAAVTGSPLADGPPATTDVAGSFEIAVPAEGFVDLTALAPGWALARLPRVDPGAEEPVVLRLGRGGGILLSVVDVTGQPVAGRQPVIEAALPEPGSELLTLMVPVPPTGESGETRIAPLAPGDYFVRLVEQPQAARIRVTVSEGSDAPARIELP